MKALPNAIQVLDASGRLVSLAARAGGPAHDRRRALPQLPKGAYTVRWHALSGDGHVVSGVYTFGVRVAGAAADGGLRRVRADARPSTSCAGCTSSALALLVGGLGFRLVVLRGAAAAARSSSASTSLAGIGVVGVLEVGILAFLLRAEDALQLPFARVPLRRPVADRRRHALRARRSSR